MKNLKIISLHSKKNVLQILQIFQSIMASAKQIKSASISDKSCNEKIMVIKTCDQV